MKKVLALLSAAGLGMAGYFMFNLVSVLFGVWVYVPEEEFSKSLEKSQNAGKESLHFAFSQFVSHSGHRKKHGGKLQNRVPTMDQSDEGEVDPSTLSFRDAFDQLKDRLDGKRPANPNMLVGLINRMQLSTETNLEVSEFALHELSNSRGRPLISDRNQLMQYLYSTASVYMASNPQADRNFDSMVRIVAQYEDRDLRRTLALAFIEKNAEKQEAFLRALEAKNVYYPLAVEGSPAGPTEDTRDH